MRLLNLEITEPLPGLVLPEMALECGSEEAARRYRAIVLTTLRQLRFLADSRIRISVSPEDADEAVRFWLLPKLADNWHAANRTYTTAGWKIDFGGDLSGFTVMATAEVLCPNLGARWVHTGLLAMGRATNEVIGVSETEDEYFHAFFTGDSSDDLPPRFLPELPIIRTCDDWEAALDSALGGALKKAWEEEA